jgi:hypothetical protein
MVKPVVAMAGRLAPASGSSPPEVRATERAGLRSRQTRSRRDRNHGLGQTARFDRHALRGGQPGPLAPGADAGSARCFLFSAAPPGDARREYRQSGTGRVAQVVRARP